jgi:hypothetical protein
MTEIDYAQTLDLARQHRQAIYDGAKEARLWYLEVEIQTRQILPMCEPKAIKSIRRWDDRTHQFLASCRPVDES